MCGIIKKYVFVHDLTKDIRLNVSHLTISVISSTKSKKKASLQSENVVRCKDRKMFNFSQEGGYFF